MRRRLRDEIKQLVDQRLAEHRRAEIQAAQHNRTIAHYRPIPLNGELITTTKRDPRDEHF